MTHDAPAPDVHHDPAARRFHTRLEGREAELLYSLRDGRMVIDHTGVPDDYKGQGVGLALVTRAVEDARRDGVKITPLCPFAAAQFRRHPEWSDVLAK